MKIKKSVIITILFIISAALISFIILSRPYKIGIILSTDTSLGNEENLAAHYYEDKIKPIGLHPVKLVFSTPNASEESIRSKCRELINEKVSVIVGGSLSSSGVIIYDELSTEQIPLWGVTVSTSELNGIKDNFFRTIASTDIVGESFGIHLQSRGIERLLIIKSIDNRSYSDSLSSSVFQRFNGIEEEIYYSDGWEASIVPSIDAVISILPASEFMQVIKTVRALAPNAEIYSTDWGFEELLSLFSDDDIEGVYAVSRRGALEPEFADLMREFADEINIQPTYGAVTVFATLDIVLNGLKNVGGNPESLIKFYSVPGRYSSGYGKVYIDEFGDAYPMQLFFKQIRNSEVEIIGRVNYEKQQ